MFQNKRSSTNSNVDLKEANCFQSSWQKQEGSTHPQGATWIEEEKAWNFVICSKNASSVTLLLYSKNEHTHPIFTYKFNPLINKSGPMWHCRIPEDKIYDACFYAYKIDGPIVQDDDFHHFDKNKIVLDPFALSVFFPPQFSREAACHPGCNDGMAPLGVLIKPDNFDWEETKPCHNDQLIIYEVHVRGFTKHYSSELASEIRGTFRALIEKIPYLKELGITAVELMPIYQFDPQEKNYWGYMPINFFTPHSKYCASKYGQEQRLEFKEMVKALHRAGIEVILDVVYNHTGEGGFNQPAYSFKLIDNSGYYIKSNNPNDPYANFTGCGNTLDSNDVAVQTLIVESLKYWREEYHIDGFRFDLASIFTRRSDGSINNQRPPIFALIRSSRDLADVILIAEPWDAAGAYQLGRGFPGWLWLQWNGRFRDIIQHFIRGDDGLISELMTRLYGSCDLFPDDITHACHPWQSVNYISSHDGSSLYDMVSFEEKQNWANGENNRDGCYEPKWNCGWEGNQDVPEEIFNLRKQQVKNFFCLLLLANGTPMFRMGDEFLQTQGGNNNPYNQDNDISWLNWHLLKQNQDMFRFVKDMIRLRKETPSISRSHFWRDDVTWYGTEQGVDTTSNMLAFYLKGKNLDACDIYVMINGSNSQQSFRIQEQNLIPWQKVVDTALPSPRDITLDLEQLTDQARYNLQPRSIVVLAR